MVEQDVIAKLRSLSKREKDILLLVCDGRSYEEIAEEFFISINTVKSHVGHIYIKLGLDGLPRSLRRTILSKEYCEILKSLNYPLSVLRKDEIDDETEPEQVPPEIIDQVEEDENAIVVIDPKKTKIIPIEQKKKKKKRIPWKLILALIIIAVLAFGGYKIYELVSQFIESFQIQATPNQDNEETQIAQILSTTTFQTLEMSVTQTDTLEPEPTITPTNTAVIPTNTPTPTSLPTPTILFFDDFNQGLSSGWQVVYGNPIVVNGQLTTDENTLLIIGDTAWTDYSVEFSAEAAGCWFMGDENWISIRSTDTSNMYAYKWEDCESAWYKVTSGSWKEIPQSEFKPGYGLLNFRIDVQGDSITLFIDGMQQTSFFDGTFTNGRIELMIEADTIIDDFKVSKLD